MQTSCMLLLKSQQEICAAWVLKISKDSEVVLFKATLKSTPSASPFFSYSHLLQASRPEAQEVYLPLRKEQNRSKQQVSRWKQALAIQSHTTKISCRNQVNQWVKETKRRRREKLLIGPQSKLHALILKWARPPSSDRWTLHPYWTSDIRAAP